MEFGDFFVSKLHFKTIFHYYALMVDQYSSDYVYDGIMDGDLVIIDKSQIAISGKIVIACQGGDFYDQKRQANNRQQIRYVVAHDI